jgi:hypothetical protein
MSVTLGTTIADLPLVNLPETPGLFLSPNFSHPITPLQDCLDPNQVDTHGLTPVALAAEDHFIPFEVFAPSNSRARNAFTYGLTPVVLSVNLIDIPDLSTLKNLEPPEWFRAKQTAFRRAHTNPSSSHHLLFSGTRSLRCSIRALNLV